MGDAKLWTLPLMAMSGTHCLTQVLLVLTMCVFLLPCTGVALSGGAPPYGPVCWPTLEPQDTRNIDNSIRPHALQVAWIPFCLQCMLLNLTPHLLLRITKLCVALCPTKTGSPAAAAAPGAAACHDKPVCRVSFIPVWVWKSLHVW